MTGVQNALPQGPRVQRFANEPSANLIGAGLVVATGAATALYEGVTEPFKMVADIARVGWETGVSLIPGKMPEDIEYYSGFGKAIVDQDMGTLDALWSIPKGIALTPWRLGTAIYEGDAFGIGYETVFLIGALEGARTLGAGRVNVPGFGAIYRGTSYVRDLSDAVGTANRLDISNLGVLEAAQGDVYSEARGAVGGLSSRINSWEDLGIPKNLATIVAYRVEGSIEPNHRLLISETGEVSLVPGNENVIWLNFGKESRATSYLQRKIDAGLPGAQLKLFEVDASFVERLRGDAVPEQLARMNPNKPIVSADPYPDQFGLPKSYFEDLLNSVKQGTGKNGH
ncbi:MULTISPECIES: hypothetical protein [unclassified Xanthomonas]|uniref:hypothetical protein n=1 Tax=unclassified Xanthomonas TaxID=2643310 RepID=UPI002B238AD2|nr:MULTISPECIES: hypothetical protein [unclassified Xanthomonas]MEA9566900.1 hypothetical protein [Xanthomonas sp. WHRI 8932A]MEA9636326.1 hypothetical protein [Xanthomonas sp. WHRI 8812E]